MTKAIAVANQKGGVGKTTTAVTLAHGLAIAGRKVLLVDLDPQGHVAISLGLEKQPGLSNLIVDNRPLDEVVMGARDNLDIVAGNKTTEGVKRHVVSMDFRELVLSESLKDAEGEYDVVVIDMPPSLDVLQVATLVYVDWVMIPAKLDHLAIDGINELGNSMAEMARHGHAFEGFCIIPTFFDRVTKETARKYREVAGVYKEMLWRPIPADTQVREAATAGKTIWEHAPSCKAVRGYKGQDGYIGGYAEVVERIVKEMEL